MARRGPDRIDPRVDALHATPPDEFVARRDAVARELAAAGDPGAAEVRKLPRPTLPVWAVNLAARREPAATEALLEAGDEVVRAHGIVLGGGGGEALLRANRALGEALERAVAAAARLAAEEGRPLSVSMSGRVRSTLRSMAVGDAAGRDLLRGGRVSAESATTGLEALGSLSPTPAGASRGPGHPAPRRPPVREPGAHRGRRDRDAGAPPPRPAARAARDRDARDSEAREGEARAARAAREQEARDRAAAAEARRRVRSLERELGRSEAGALGLRRDRDAVRRRSEEIEARLREAEARAAEVRRQLEDARLLVARLQRD